MRRALNEITIDTGKNVKLKKQDNINSPLFKKRFKKANDTTKNENELEESMISIRIDQRMSSDSSSDLLMK